MTLDLHGLREDEAIAKVEMALMSFQDNTRVSMLEIIAGKGIVLHDLVRETLDDYGLNWSHPGTNTGSFIIRK